MLFKLTKKKKKKQETKIKIKAYVCLWITSVFDLCSKIPVHVVWVEKQKDMQFFLKRGHSFKNKKDTILVINLCQTINNLQGYYEKVSFYRKKGYKTVSFIAAFLFDLLKNF